MNAKFYIWCDGRLKLACTMDVRPYCSAIVAGTRAAGSTFTAQLVDTCMLLLGPVREALERSEGPDRDMSMSWYPLLSSLVVCSPRRRKSSRRIRPDSNPSMNSLV